MLELKRTPFGRVPVSVIVGGGQPVAVTVNVLEVPSIKVVLEVEVMAGAWSAGKVPSPGLLMPQSVESVWTSNGCGEEVGLGEADVAAAALADVEHALVGRSRDHSGRHCSSRRA